MGSPSSRTPWKEIRRKLILGIVLIGAISVYSLVWGRPGDFQAGAIGGVFAGLIALIVIAVELMMRWVVRKRPNSEEQGPSP
jgi:hypothetical protein